MNMRDENEELVKSNVSENGSSVIQFSFYEIKSQNSKERSKS